MTMTSSALDYADRTNENSQSNGYEQEVMGGRTKCFRVRRTFFHPKKKKKYNAESMCRKCYAVVPVPIHHMLTRAHELGIYKPPKDYVSVSHTHCRPA